MTWKSHQFKKKKKKEYLPLINILISDRKSILFQLKWHAPLSWYTWTFKCTLFVSQAVHNIAMLSLSNIQNITSLSSHKSGQICQFWSLFDILRIPEFLSLLLSGPSITKGTNKKPEVAWTNFSSFCCAYFSIPNSECWTEQNNTWQLSKLLQQFLFLFLNQFSVFPAKTLPVC